jgi:hypothetical protein
VTCGYSGVAIIADLAIPDNIDPLDGGMETLTDESICDIAINPRENVLAVTIDTVLGVH